MSCISGWMVVTLVSLGQAEGLATTATRVAVVNVPAVSERYLRTDDLERQFESKRVKLAQERDTLRESIDRTTRSLREEFKPGTEEYGQRAKKLVLLEAEMQWLVESQGRRIERELAASLRAIFGDIQDMIAKLADEKNIDVVLAVDVLPDETPLGTSQARQQIVLQKVLYWRPSVDLTDALVVRLNAWYKEEQAQSPDSPKK